MNNPDFRALCIELLGELQTLRRAVADELGCPSSESSMILRARAALSEPAPELAAPPDLVQQWRCVAPEPMANLSPAAQDIVKAFDDQWGYHFREDSWQGKNWQKQCIAAVLRVIADQLIDNWCEIDNADVHLIMWKQYGDYHAIANELEALSND
jgi:hypothetical protein